MQAWKPVAKSRFFSVRELVIYFFIFLGVCLLVYPKARIERYISLPESRNLDLSIIYARNLLRASDLPVFRVYLVESLIQAGMIKGAEEETTRLLGTTYEDRGYFALYKMEKSRYFAGRSSGTDLMQDYLIKALRASEDKELILEIYREAVLMNLPYVAMLSSEKLYRLEENISWLKEAYKYALGLGNTEMALKYAIELYKKDVNQREKYKEDMAYLLLKSEEGKLLLEKYKAMMGELLYAEVLARIEPSMLTPVQVGEVMEEYMKLFMTTQDYEERKQLFMKIVQMYLWKENYAGAKAFIAKHYGPFIRDKEVALFILKSALAIGDTFFTQRMALEVKKVFIR